MKKGDIDFVDYSFRDVVSFLKEKGILLLIPTLKGKKKYFNL